MGGKISNLLNRTHIVSEATDSILLVDSKDAFVATNPKRKETKLSYSMERWNKAIAALNLNLPSAYNDVMFILQHDDWFTNSEMDEIRRLAAQHPFTSKQQYRISNPPSLERQDDYEGDYGYGDY